MCSQDAQARRPEVTPVAAVLRARRGPAASGWSLTYTQDSCIIIEVSALSSQELLDEPALERAARMFFAVGEPGRLRILERLAAGEQCVGDLSAQLHLPLPILSQRLKVLFSHGLLRRRRAGRHIYYALADDHIALLIANALAHFGATHERNRP